MTPSDMVEKFMKRLSDRKYNPLPTIRDNRLHKIVGYVISRCEKLDESGKAERYWSFTELLPAIAESKRETNIYEIEGLCEILVEEEVVWISDGTKGRGIIITEHNLLNCRKAFYSGKYEEKVDKWILPLNIASFANALAVTAGVVVTVVSCQDKQILNRLGEQVRERDKILKSTTLSVDSMKRASKKLRGENDSLRTVLSIQKAASQDQPPKPKKH